MCLGVPGKIVEIFEKENIRMCTVDFGGVQREVCLDFVPPSQGRRLHHHPCRFCHQSAE